MWSRVARILRAAGHDVFTPSLTGIGERLHLASPQVATFRQKISLRGAYRGPRTYIFCSGYAPSTFAPTAQRLRADPAWRYHELPTHHYPQVSMPQETAALLMG